MLGDFDQDNLLTAADIDLLSEAVRDSSNDLQFDINMDGEVSNSDREFWVSDLAMTYFGDSNLDQAVNFNDFLPMALSFGGTGGWADGDFDGSGEVKFSDFVHLATNFGKRSGEVASVPEPSSMALFAWFVFVVRRGRSDRHRVTIKSVS